MLFKKRINAPAVTEEPAHNYYVNGPKPANGQHNCPWIMFKSDWSPTFGLLWIRPNTEEQRNVIICSSDPEGTKPRDLDLEAIIDFVKRSNALRHVVILTKNACGQYPTNVSLSKSNSGRIKIETSIFCEPKDVDAQTIQLAQTILDCWNSHVDFKANIKDWKKACRA